VVTYAAIADEDSHIRAARIGLAKKLAALKGYGFAGEYDPSSPPAHAGRLYFVPSNTLLGSAAAALGIGGEHDLFGGVVPHGFVATKVITHPLVHPDATAPPGWSHAFGDRVRDAVLSGFSAFTREDARRAGARLLEQGPARTKPGRATAGRDQTVVSSMAELDSVLDAMGPEEPLRHGLVIEENLTEVATFSVGQVRVAELVATYHGTQRLTTDNRGGVVYGGSDLTIVRSGFEALLGLGLPDEAQLAVAQAQVYDAAAFELFAGLFVSRRNYDVASGVNPRGVRRTGVLEQSWRPGGASAAEIAALEAFRADPALAAVRASTFEVYGSSEPPPGAVVYFHGIDERVGPMSRYATVEPHDGAR
jgi:hypothetical protein